MTITAGTTRLVNLTDLPTWQRFRIVSGAGLGLALTGKTGTVIIEAAASAQGKVSVLMDGEDHLRPWKPGWADVPTVIDLGGWAHRLEAADAAGQALGNGLARGAIADILRRPVMNLSRALRNLPGFDLRDAAAEVEQAIEAVIRSGS